MTSQPNDTKSSARLVFHKENQCEGKKQFENEVKAQRAAIALGKNKKGNKKVNYYVCPYCEQWHVGKIPTYIRTHPDYNKSREVR